MVHRSVGTHVWHFRQERKYLVGEQVKQPFGDGVVAFDDLVVVLFERFQRISDRAGRAGQLQDRVPVVHRVAAVLEPRFVAVRVHHVVVGDRLPRIPQDLADALRVVSAPRRRAMLGRELRPDPVHLLEEDCSHQVLRSRPLRGRVVPRLVNHLVPSPRSLQQLAVRNRRYLDHVIEIEQRFHQPERVCLLCKRQVKRL